jgi:hypothetical protein
MLLLYHLYLYSYDQLRFILSNLLLFSRPISFALALSTETSSLFCTVRLQFHFSMTHSRAPSFLRPALFASVIPTWLQFSFRVPHSCAAMRHILSFFIAYRAARIGQAQTEACASHCRFFSSTAAFPTSSQRFLFPGTSAIAPSSFTHGTYRVFGIKESEPLVP